MKERYRPNDGNSGTGGSSGSLGTKGDTNGSISIKNANMHIAKKMCDGASDFKVGTAGTSKKDKKPYSAVSSNGNGVTTMVTELVAMEVEHVAFSESEKYQCRSRYYCAWRRGYPEEFLQLELNKPSRIFKNSRNYTKFLLYCRKPLHISKESIPRKQQAAAPHGPRHSSGSPSPPSDALPTLRQKNQS